MANAFAENETVLPDGSGPPLIAPADTGATDSPSGIPGITSPSNLMGPKGVLTGYQRQKTADDESTNRTYDRQSKFDRDQMDAAYKKESSGPDSLPPKWDAATERQKNSTGPMEAFGSVGMIFALAASAFTKAPMTSALKAGGAVLEAIHSGDEERYKSAYQAWKDNTDLALKRFQMERELFEDTNKLMSTDTEQWRVKTAENAARFGDQTKLAMLEAGMDPQVLEAQTALTKAAEQAMDYADKFQTHDAQMSILRAEDAAFREKNGIPPGKEGDKDLRLIHYKLGVLESLHEPANSEQTLLMKNWRNEVISKEHRMPTSEEEVKKLKEVQATVSGNASNFAFQQFVQETRDREGRDPTAEETQKFLQQGKMGRSPLAMAMSQYVAETVDKTGKPPDSSGLTQFAAEFNRDQKTSRDYSGSGKGAQTVNSLSVAVDHLDTLRQLATALNNKNMPLFNQLSQAWAVQNGVTAPTDFDTAKQIIGQEIVKAVVNGGGGVTERTAAQSLLDKKYSAKVIGSQIDTVEKLMAGQLRGQKRTYQAGTTVNGVARTDFDEKLSPRAREVLGDLDSSAATKVSSPADAAKLPLGTHYVTPDGKEYVR